jgi:hypothetical protein
LDKFEPTAILNPSRKRGGANNAGARAFRFGAAGLLAARDIAPANTKKKSFEFRDARAGKIRTLRRSSRGAGRGAKEFSRLRERRV